VSPPDTESPPPGGHIAAELFARAATLAETGDIDGALVAYQEVLNHPESEFAAQAGYEIGLALHQRGDVAGATAAFRRGMDAEDSPYMSACAVNCGSLLINQGDPAGALAATRRALMSRYTANAALAHYYSGLSAQQMGDVPAAVEAYQQAVANQQPDYSPKAGLQLAQLLAAQGDTEQACAAYQQVLSYPESGLAAQAGFELGKALKAAGDTAGAATAFHRGLDAADSAYRGYCGAQLGALLAEQGDNASALAVNLRALKTEHADGAALASENVGFFAEKTGDIRLAIAAYRQSTAYRQPTDSTWALAQLQALFGVGEPLTLEIEGFSGDEQQASRPGVVLALSDVASCRLSMTVTYGAIGSGKSGQSGALELAAASATGSDLVFRWANKKTDDGLFKQLADYVVRTVGPHVAERLLPAVTDGDGISIGGVKLSPGGVEAVKSGLKGRKVDVLPWTEFAGCGWSALEVRIYRRDPNGGKSTSFASVSRNVPNVFVLPALMNLAARSLKDRPPESRPPESQPQASREPRVVGVPLQGLKQLNAFDVSDSGQVAIIDSRTLGPRVVLYDPEHETQTKLPFPKLQRPSTIAITDSGTVYVVERNPKRPAVWCLHRGEPSANALPTSFIPSRAASGGPSLYVAAPDDGKMFPSRRVFKFSGDGGGPLQLPFTGAVEIVALSANSRGDVVIGGGEGVLAKMGPDSQQEQLLEIGIRIDALALNERGDIFIGGADRILFVAADSTEPQLVTRVSGLVGLACNKTGALFVGTSIQSRDAWVNKLVSIAFEA
jgi:tetratricopeptide (TPR) repeat protein